MRKHFLLLMMTFMSVMAFAATDLSEVNFSAPDFEYGTATQPDFLVTYDITLTKDIHYTWDGKYYSDAACETEAEYTVSTLPVGTYYVKIAGIGIAGFTGTKIQSFNVIRAKLMVTVTASPASVDREYDGTTTKPDGVTLTWSGSGYKNSETDAVVHGDLEWTYSDPSVGKPTIAYSGLSADNYTIEYATNNFLETTKRTLTAGMITAVTLSETYKGAAFTPSTLAVNIADGELLTTDDYEIKTYSDELLTSEVASPKDVGKYYIGISASSSGNYKTTSPLAAGTFTITKANMTVKANDQSHTYDGTAISSHFNSTEYTYIGLVGGDKASDVTGTTIAVADASKTAADSYAITASGSTNSNYNIFFQPGTYTIKKADLTITAENKSWVYGAAEPTYTVTLTGAVSGEETDINAAVTVGRAAGDNEALGEHAIVVSYDADAAVFANYNVAKVDGVVTISGGDIVVTVNPQTIAYGEDEPNWASPTLGTDYFVNGLATGDALTVTLTREDPDNKNVGSYDVTASATLPAGYSSINFVNSTFTINKKTLTVTADQTLIIGQTAANLSLDADDVDGLASWDAIKDVITLSFDSSVDVDGDGKLTTAKTYNDGIIIGLTAAADKNYKLSATKADLTVIAALVLNRAAKADFADPSKNDDAAVIAAADGNTVTATFGDFSMYGEKWYSLVLPFATSVKEISAAFGYALVDILDETNSSTDDVTFKVHMGDIPANTPFIFKVYKAMNMNAATFNGVTIANPADASEVAVSDAAGNKFIGTYTGKNGGFDSATDYVFGLGESATTYQKASATFYVRPLGAWITFNAAATAPRINIEELDGSFTTINVVANENAADGNNWYNVNGMKMESAPAQKGVYIRNGKKFVVK